MDGRSQKASGLHRLAYRLLGCRLRPAPFVSPEDAADGLIFRPHFIDQEVVAGAGSDLVSIAVAFGMRFLPSQHLLKGQARAGAIRESPTILQDVCSGGYAGR